MITIRSLKKSYGDTHAIKGIDLDIYDGECFGLIGPNGAGKTTTLKTLATLIKPDYGVALVDGIDIVAQPDQVRRIVGFMPDQFESYLGTKTLHFLDYYAAMVGLRGKERVQQVCQVLELTDLMPKKDDLVSSLSRGNKQRLCLAKTLLHNPKVLLLDEPAANLDPRARIEFRILLKELKQFGKTIIISSHILEDLQEICDRVAIYEAGEIVRCGAVNTLVQEVTSQAELRLTIREPNQAVQGLLENLDAVASVENQNDQVFTVSLAGDSLDNSPVLRCLLDNNIQVLAFSEHHPELADVFLDLTRGEIS